MQVEENVGALQRGLMASSSLKEMMRAHDGVVARLALCDVLTEVMGLSND